VKSPGKGHHVFPIGELRPGWGAIEAQFSRGAQFQGPETEFFREKPIFSFLGFAQKSGGEVEQNLQTS
jgi:hypothetical protein